MLAVTDMVCSYGSKALKHVIDEGNKYRQREIFSLSTLEVVSEFGKCTKMRFVLSNGRAPGVE